MATGAGPVPAAFMGPCTVPGNNPTLFAKDRQEIKDGTLTPNASPENKTDKEKHAQDS